MDFVPFHESMGVQNAATIDAFHSCASLDEACERILVRNHTLFQHVDIHPERILHVSSLQVTTYQGCPREDGSAQKPFEDVESIFKATTFRESEDQILAE
jgi:hypothetical protein